MFRIDGTPNFYSRLVMEATGVNSQQAAEAIENAMRAMKPNGCLDDLNRHAFFALAIRAKREASFSPGNFRS